MIIRKVITSAAMVAVLGLAGGSAYADDTDSHINDEIFTVLADANYSVAVFVYDDSYVGFDKILSTAGFEKARLPQNFKTN